MSRDKILEAIKEKKPKELPLPEKFIVESEYADLVKPYLDVLKSIGGKGKLVVDWHDILFCLQQRISEGKQVVNGIPKLAPYNLDQYVGKNATDLDGVQTVFLMGELGVAENASIWLSEEAMGNRLLPFICEELILVIKQANIVGTMHEVYDNIQADESGYGTFISGPSKTADIEQSLVIGAHGPLELQVFILINPQDVSTLAR
jgi:L-lactate dehydrogenase complex protein LldG